MFECPDCTNNKVSSLRIKRSVGFQSRERPKNEILIILPRKKWERVKKWIEGGGGKELWNKKWSRGREGGKGNACQQRSLF